MRSFAPDFELVNAPDVAFAMKLLSEGEGWRPIAGGTDLMVLFNAGKLPWNRLVSVREIPELRTIAIYPNRVAIGASVTYSQIRRDAMLQTQFPNLCAAAGWTGGVSNQNRGTLGGNIMNASPAADSAPALLAYDAELEFASRDGLRTMPYREFHTGYKMMQLQAGELLVRIHLPVRDSGWQDYIRKVGARRAQAISKLCLAASAKVQRGVVEEIRVAMGSVAPFSLRCVVTEEMVRGKPVSQSLVEAARASLTAEISPISDVRSTAAYRSHVAANLLAEFLHALR